MSRVRNQAFLVHSKSGTGWGFWILNKKLDRKVTDTRRVKKAKDSRLQPQVNPTQKVL